MLQTGHSCWSGSLTSDHMIPMATLLDAKAYIFMPIIQLNKSGSCPEVKLTIILASGSAWLTDQPKSFLCKKDILIVQVLSLGEQSSGAGGCHVSL